MWVKRGFLAAALSASICTIIISYTQITGVDLPNPVQGRELQENHRVLLERLHDFPNTIKALETKILTLEKGIRDFGGPSPSEGQQVKSAKQAEDNPVGNRSNQSAPGVGTDVRWRKDTKCGPSYPFPDGKPAECDPKGKYPCCGGSGWCGVTDDHCRCSTCIDFRNHDVRSQNKALIAFEGQKPEAPAGTANDGPTGSSSNQPVPDALNARWRNDLRCGPSNILQNGKPAECDPKSKFPCCGNSGWCGVSDEHCRCSTCTDHRSPSNTTNKSLPGNRTVLVVIPFRDREEHWVKFKEYWIDYGVNGLNGTSPRRTTQWEFFLVEQFDGEPFNRGWNFNVGFAIASGLKSASPDIRDDAKIQMHCAVIQDIDYLPEPGVDYADCVWPTQLSSEIDIYDWKTPYLQNAGGIIALRPEHWTTINGFGNNYFGWGGEDDELHNRLRINGLLKGDCYPFCKPNDKNRGKAGQSIRRPQPGRGRFSGKAMRFINHTRRITDGHAYRENLKMLKEIRASGPRWKRDGLNSLSFRVLNTDVDMSQAAIGIKFTHVRVRRGSQPFNLKGIRLLVPPHLCSSSAKGLALTTIPENVFNISDLRSAAKTSAKNEFGVCNVTRFDSISFLLVDNARGLGKTFSNETPRSLRSFYRSLADPARDGFVIADTRTSSELYAVFKDVGSILVPPTLHRICNKNNANDSPLYNIATGDQCSPGWKHANGGKFHAHLIPRPGYEPVSACSNKKNDNQRYVKGTVCDELWNGLSWEHDGTFWVPASGTPNDGTYCVSTRTKRAPQYSQIQLATNCQSGDFVQDFTFGGVLIDENALQTMLICIAQDGSKGRNTRVINKRSLCHGPGFHAAISFTARKKPYLNDRNFCVVQKGGMDTIVEKNGDCEKKAKFSFSLPSSAGNGSVGSTNSVCVHDEALVDVGCQIPKTPTLKFSVPSIEDMSASVPRIGGNDGMAALFALVDEAVPCGGLVCPDVEL